MSNFNFLKTYMFRNAAKRGIIVFTVILWGLNMNAQTYDFSAPSGETTFYYRITSSTSPRTVEIAPKAVDSTNRLAYYGHVEIPLSVTYEGNTYTVTKIGNWAFYRCFDLTSVTIPSSVTTLGKSAFIACTALPSVTIPASVTSIGPSAFAYCYSLTSVTLPNTINTLDNSTFMYCPLTSLDIPSSVTTIGDSTFYKSKLTSVTIPNSVLTIGTGAFNSCDSLTSVTIPSSVTLIKGLAFNKCSKLSIVNFNAVRANLQLGLADTSTTPWVITSPFGLCPLFSTLNIGDNVKRIGMVAFLDCDGLNSIVIGNEVDTVELGAFADCNNLTEVTIGEEVDYIHYAAFQGDSSLSKVYFNAVNCLSADSLFTGCPLTTLRIGNDVERIPAYLFYGCDQLLSVTIPQKVMNIGEYAFSGCNALTDVVNRRPGPQTIQANVFNTTTYNNATLHVPSSSVSTYTGATGWQNFYDIVAINPVTGVTLNQHTLSLDAGQTEQLTTTITPSNADIQDVVWSSDNPDVASVDINGSITAVSPGVTTIKVTTVDGNYTDSCMVTVVPGTGISVNTSDSFRIYPNPVTETFSVMLPDNSSKATLVLYDLQGKALIMQTIENQNSISVNELPAGIYVVTITMHDHIYRGKFIKQ